MRQYLVLIIFISWSKSTLTQTQTNRLNSTTTKPITIEFKCPFLPKCTCTQNELYCANFDQFVELNFTRDGDNRSMPFNLIKLKPRQRQNITETNLNLTGLTIASSGVVEISNIDWIYFRANPFKTLKRIDYNHFTTILKLTDSKFQFMLDETHTLNSVCATDKTLFKTVDEKSINESKIILDHSLMSSVNLLELESIDFVEPICPLIFNEVRISIMSLRNPARGSSFKFMPMQIDRPSRNVSHYRKLYEITGLDAFVKTLVFENLDYEQIDSNVLNVDVFSAVQSISFRNVRVRKIEPNSFVNFKYLNRLEMELPNWKDLVDRNELQWMYDLNRYVQPVNMSKLSQFADNKMVFLVNFTNYSLPEDDFCKFYNFPLNRYVVPYIKTNKTNTELKCNCVISWLLQYYKSYPSDYEFSQSSGQWEQCVNDLNSRGTCNDLKDKDHCTLYNPSSLRLSDASIKRKHGQFSIKSPFIIAVLVTLMALFLLGGAYFITRGLKRAQQASERDNHEQQNVEATNFI